MLVYITWKQIIWIYIIFINLQRSPDLTLSAKYVNSTRICGIMFHPNTAYIYNYTEGMCRRVGGGANILGVVGGF